jgi:lipopolysaccharide export system protein LptA
VFTGPVHAVQGTRLDLRAARVVAFLDPNPATQGGPASVAGPLSTLVRPSRVEATGGVTARVGTTSTPLELAGDRMVYTPGDNETIEVTGNPRWNGETHRGSADRFVIHPKGPAFEAFDNVQVAWSTGAPANQGAPAAPIELTASRMSVDPRAARFSGTVRAHRDTWNVACASLEFGLGTNAAPRSFDARGGVLLDYLMPPPRPGSTNLLAGTADRLVDLATEPARRWRIRSEEVHAELAPDGAEPVALDATGKVRIDHTEITATGARLTYRAEEGLMHLTGDSRLDTRNGLVIVGKPDSALTFDPRAPRFSVQRSWQTLRLPGRLLRGPTNPPSPAKATPPTTR